MQETDFYKEIADRIEKYIASYLSPGYEASSSIGSRALGELVRELESKLGGKTVFSGGYMPPLELDILIGIKRPDGMINLWRIQL